MDQDDTWQGGRPRPKTRVRWGPRSLQRSTAAEFWGHVYCGQMVYGWIMMPLGMEVGFGAGHTVLDWESAPPWKGRPTFAAYRRRQATFRPMSIVSKLSPISATAELLLSTLPSCCGFMRVCPHLQIWGIMPHFQAEVCA